MNLNITLIKQVVATQKKLFVFALTIVFFFSSNAQTYTNGNLGTGTVSKAGVAAPAGIQWHEMQNNIGDNTVANSALAFNMSGNFHVSDNFTVPVGQTWTITGASFYGIQVTASPVTAVGVVIRNGSPLAGGTVVFGSLATNYYTTTVAANARVITSSANPANVAWAGNPLNVSEINTAFSTVLTAGTYWINWQVASTNAYYNVFSQITGARSQPSNNALINNTGTWGALTDAGAPAGAAVPMDLCFKINYTVTGASACSTPAVDTALSTLSARCPGLPFNLSLKNGTLGAGVTYQWQSASTATGPWNNIIGATIPTLTYSLSATTFYRCNVTCGATTVPSKAVEVTASTGCYCVPTAINCTLDDRIASVTFGTLTNTSGLTCTGGYSNYTNTTPVTTVPDIIQGAAMPISVTVGPGGTEHVGVWIDYNQNGTFDPTEFQYLGSTTGTINGTINIPATALLGTTRMRIRLQWNQAVTATMPCSQPGIYGEVEDYNVKIIPCIPVTITTAPVSVSTVCGSNASFSVIAAGSLPTYQWQYRLNATSPWVDVMNVAPYTGATMATLNITNASTTLNGYQYRVRFGGACTSLDFTTFGTLTVSQLAAVVTPATASICKGSGTIVPISIGNVGASQTTTFSSAANLALPIPEVGTGVTNSIPVTLPSSAQITNIKVKMNIAHTWIGDMIIALKAPNGEVYNLSYALNGTDNGPGAFVNTVTSFGPNALGAVFPLLSTGTNPFTSTFRVDGRIASTATALDNGVNNVVRLTGPAGFTATTDVPLTFYGGSGAGTGNWTIAMYDFYDDGTNGGTINRLTNWSLDITYGALANAVFTSSPAAPSTIFTNAAATTLYDGVTAINTVYVKPDTTTIYSAAINTGTCTTTATIPVTVNTAIVGTPVVANKSACNGSNAVFTVTGITGGSGLSYQWQVSTTNPAVFSNIAGATSTSYTVLGAGQVNNSYRVIVTSAGCGSVTSSAGALTSNTNPVVTISAAPITSLFPGLFSTLTAAVSSASGTIKYQWKRNGVNSSIADTLNKAVVGIDGLGVYTVMVTDGNGCSSAGVSTPASITIKDSATTNRLFIYPSPNRGLFEVRFFNEGKAATAINIYDEKGAQVISQRFGANTAYQSMKFDMSGYAKGIYRVDVLSANGTRINTGSVLVY